MIGAVGDDIAVDHFMIAHGLAQAHAAIQAGGSSGEDGCAGFQCADLIFRDDAVTAARNRWATA